MKKIIFGLLILSACGKKDSGTFEESQNVPSSCLGRHLTLPSESTLNDEDNFRKFLVQATRAAQVCNMGTK